MLVKPFAESRLIVEDAAFSLTRSRCADSSPLLFPFCQRQHVFSVYRLPW
jgi:hypothetical protein